MKKIFLTLALFFLKLSGKKPLVLPEHLGGFLPDARLAVAEAERVGGTSEGKRREALRVLLNRLPHTEERNLNLAIEWVLCVE